MSCKLRGLDNATTADLVTDEAGRFRVTGAASGRQLLHCSHASLAGVHAVRHVFEVPSTKQGPGVVDLGAQRLELVGLIEGTARLDGPVDTSPHAAITISLVDALASQWAGDQGDFRFRHVPPGLYTVRFESPGYEPAEVEAVRVEPGQHVTLPVQTLRAEVPSHGQIRIEDGVKAVGSRTVGVSLHGFEGATHYLLSEQPAFTDASWTPMASAVSWTFTADGPHTLFARFRREGGREGLTVSASVIVDTQPPHDARVLVNGGRKRVSSRDVVLTLSAVDADSEVTEMKVGHDPLLADATWEPFVSTRAWTLPEGSPVQVHVTFRDALGHALPQPISVQVLVGPETQVSGSLPPDTHWTEEGSPYVVTGDLFIPEGGSLTIAPGVEVLFRGQHQLFVRGQLVARGTEAAPILFGAEAPDAGPGSWRGVSFADSSIDAVLDASGNYLSGSVLEHVEVRHSGAGVEIERSSPLVTDSYFHHNGEGTAALLLEQSRSVVRGNRIEQNTSRHGLFVYACDTRILGNVIQDNVIGLLLHANALGRCADDEHPALIEDNRLLRNSNSAIRVLSGSPVIQHNDLLENFRDAGAPESAETGTALSVTGGTVVFELNRVEDNRGPPGGSSSALSFAAGSVRVRDNTLRNAPAYELRLSYPTFELALTASGNDWASSILESVEARVWDGQDDPRLPSLTLTPLLEAPPPGVGAR